MKQPTTVAEMLTRLTAEPGRPRLTWYGGGGERIELSGAVLANWVSKTANLLVEEFDAAPGIRIGLDLPPHWRTVVWALAAWRCGAAVRWAGGAGAAEGAGAADVVVTDHPQRYPDSDQLVAVALAGLAREFGGEMPAGAIDAAGAVMTYGDVVGWAPPVVGGAAALLGDDLGELDHDGLFSWALAGTTAPAGSRVLVTAGRVDDSAADVVRVLREITGVLAGAGSVVLIDAAMAAELAADPARAARLVASERIDGV